MPEEVISPSKAAEKIANYLIGTASSIEQACETLEFDEGWQNNSEWCAVFDGMCFCCVQCGWWCGADEYGEDIDDQLACGECSPRDD